MQTRFDTETELVLHAIQGRVRDALIEQAMAAIRPDIVARVEAVVADMKPQVEAYRDVAYQKMVVNFSVREPRA